MDDMHGGDIYRNSIEYDFSANINPLGMPERCGQAVWESLSQSEHYPDCQGTALCCALARKEQVEESQILLGNGAAELIYVLCYAIRPECALAVVPSFGEYEQAVKAAGGHMKFWKLSEESGFHMERDVYGGWILDSQGDAMLNGKADSQSIQAAVQPGKSVFIDAITEDIQLVFLCNPNNPTGCVVDKDFLEDIALKCEQTHTFFCLDECFLPFLQEETQYTMKEKLEQFPHLIILRAFTKIYAMAGLRLGYALSANKRLLARMKSCMQPWNTSVPAQAAGIAALQDTDYIERTRNLIWQEKGYLVSEMSKDLASQIYDSKANYIFFKSREDLKRQMLKKGILIRDCRNYRNLTEGFFRIAVRSHEENTELLRRWRDLS